MHEYGFMNFFRYHHSLRPALESIPQPTINRCWPANTRAINMRTAGARFPAHARMKTKPATASHGFDFRENAAFLCYAGFMLQNREVTEHKQAAFMAVDALAGTAVHRSLVIPARWPCGRLVVRPVHPPDLSSTLADRRSAAGRAGSFCQQIDAADQSWCCCCRCASVWRHRIDSAGLFAYFADQSIVSTDCRHRCQCRSDDRSRADFCPRLG